MVNHEQPVEALPLLCEYYHVSVDELTRVSGLSGAEIQELVELGVFEPRGVTPDTWTFSTYCIGVARKAQRLRRDFDLNIAGIALALTYLERIHDLEARLRALQCEQLRQE